MSPFGLLAILLDETARSDALETSNVTNEPNAILPAYGAPSPPSSLLHYRDAEELRHQVVEILLTQGWKKRKRRPDIPKKPSPPPSLLRIERMPRDKRFPRVDYFIEHLAVQPSKKDALYFLHKPSLNSLYTSLVLSCWKRMDSFGFERSMGRASRFIEEQEQGLGTKLRQAVDLIKAGVSGGLVLILRGGAAYVFKEDGPNESAQDNHAKHKVALLVEVGCPNNGEREIRIVKQVWKERCMWKVRIMVAGAGEEGRDRQDSLGYASEENISDNEQTAMI
jgi:hypothetical protein